MIKEIWKDPVWSKVITTGILAIIASIGTYLFGVWPTVGRALSQATEIFLSVEFWKFSAPLFGGIIAWLVNEWRKRLWEQYIRKEDSYRDLLRCLKGFYQGANHSTELQSEFIDHLNRCWLYCPDEIILLGYKFLDTVNADNSTSDEARFAAMGNLISSVRKDLISRRLVRSTKLTGNDFKHLEVKEI